MADSPADSRPKLLGAGRSGQVFLVETETGSVARKVFFGDPLASLVHYFFFGAPNPYIWNEDALKCAYYRRKILSELVKMWFGSKLVIADAIDTGWHEELKAYQLDTKFVKGRTVALHQPFNQVKNTEVKDLVHNIIIPLQKRLIQAGFDGLVWQVGKGNPLALDNILLQDLTSDEYRFVWIDLESGVPALFPLNPLSLFLFYLPKSFKYARALFDDVDIPKLKKYAKADKINLEEQVGSCGYLTLLEDIEKLKHHQNKWKSMRRLDSSIQYHLKKGQITEAQAHWYKQHPLHWYARELKRVFCGGLNNLFVKLPLKIIQFLTSLSYKNFFIGFWKLFVSHQYRFNLAKNYVTRRIRHWEKRKQLKPEEAEYLLNHLQNDYTSDYLSDFGVHLGMKVFVKAIETSFFPLLYGAGFINEIVLAILLISGGSISRTVYTSYRMLQASVEGKEIPWVAFLIGLIPIFLGNLAYPCQMIYSASGKRRKVAKFIVYDTLTRLGDKFPIWGGEDTLTEHFFNHSAHIIIHIIGFRRISI